MNQPADAVIVAERAVPLGKPRWLHVAALQRPGGGLVVHLQEMVTAPATTFGDARTATRNIVQAGPVTPSGSELEIPPHALAALIRALTQIAARIGAR